MLPYQGDASGVNQGRVGLHGPNQHLQLIDNMTDQATTGAFLEAEAEREFRYWHHVTPAAFPSFLPHLFSESVSFILTLIGPSIGAGYPGTHGGSLFFRILPGFDFFPLLGIFSPSLPPKLILRTQRSRRQQPYSKSRARYNTRARSLSTLNHSFMKPSKNQNSWTRLSPATYTHSHFLALARSFANKAC